MNTLNHQFQKMEITINHPSSDGNKRTKRIVDVLDVVLDYGHELNGAVVPAIRIDSQKTRPYYISGMSLDLLEVLYIRLNISLHNNTDFVVDLDYFDPDTPNSVNPLTVEKYLEMIRWERFARTEAFAMFSWNEINCMTKKNFYPIRNQVKQNPSVLLHCWKYRLPTTQANVSKSQYFTALLCRRIVL